ncbi:MAG: hypothetical protein IJX20_04010, partial [Alphaproteobacteria bacterium]|nr:hypothetical protein [Alphaproteobacteria bacterium]
IQLMIRLKINKEPYWLELGYGVKVKVKPCTSAVFYEAKAYMNSKLSEFAKIYQANKAAGIEDNLLADIENPIKREALADKFLLIGLGIAGILEWNGVMDAEKDEVAPLNESKIDELFSNFWAVAENFRHQYCSLHEIIEAEKNAYTPEPNGTSVTGEVIAKGVEKEKTSVHSTSANTPEQP